MKKSSVVNLTTVCCLLFLCVTTLIVIYATAPETSVVLFEENFNSLDENKWTHEAAECKEDGESFHYTAANSENRYTVDGTLHFFTTPTEDAGRTKRETQSKCDSCINWQNGAVDCFSSKYSARLRTKAAFHVSSGEIEVRSRLPNDHFFKLTILIVPAKNESQTEAWGGFVVTKESEEVGRNCSADIQIFSGSNANQSVIESAVTDNNFHLYKIEWDCSKILFSLDRQIVFEKVFQEQGNNPRSKKGPEETLPINQPFYLKMGVDLGESDLKCHRVHSDQKRSLTHPVDSSILDVDYIRFIKILK